MKQVTAILLGAGQRGADVYAEYALQFPNELKIIAVAEPRKDRREAFAQLHNIPAENVTDTWEPLLEREKFADCVLVSVWICYTLPAGHCRPVWSIV